MKPATILNITAQSIQKYRNWPEIVLFFAKKQQPTRVVLRDGSIFEAPEVFLGVIDEIIFQRVYTPVHLEIEKNDIVIDIGAHIGVFTVFAASQTHNTVYAFEPCPDTFNSLKRNISVNKLNNVITYNVAVSDKVGAGSLLLSPKRNTRHLLSDKIILDTLEKYRSNLEHLPFQTQMPGELEEYVEVQTTALQEIMEIYNIEQVGFLKMDCEGTEGLILDSTPKAYLKKVRKIAIEFHDHLSKLDHDQIRKLLEETGFTTRLKWDSKSPLGYIFGWRE